MKHMQIFGSAKREKEREETPSTIKRKMLRSSIETDKNVKVSGTVISRIEREEGSFPGRGRIRDKQAEHRSTKISLAKSGHVENLRMAT